MNDRAQKQGVIEVRYPFTGEIVGTVRRASVEDVRKAFAWARAYKSKLTRYERSNIFNKAAALLRDRVAEASDLITRESGLSKKDSTYEVGRVSDVFTFSAMEALRDDGQAFSCDLTPHGKNRRVYTRREPLLGVISAITPFNHPMNQVAHKVAPSIATNNRMVLKPSEKTPMSAYYLAELLYEAGLPREMFQVITGDPREIADELITNENVDLVTFTGGVRSGKYIASRPATAGSCSSWAATTRSSSWRMPTSTRPRRLRPGLLQEQRPALHGGQAMLVHEAVADRSSSSWSAKTRAWTFGDPMDPKVEMGTVIDEPPRSSSRPGERGSLAGREAAGGQRARGALYSPTVVDRVDPKMTLVMQETFGPVLAGVRFRTSTRRSRSPTAPRTARPPPSAPTASTTSTASSPSCRWDR
jgi:acyl-CoA reductase-like NAD-dependent aldehyde dehydrogenase